MPLNFRCGISIAYEERNHPGIIGYGHLPLMQMRACPAKRGGAGCTGRPTPRPAGESFPLLCHGKALVYAVQLIPLYIGDKLPGDVGFCYIVFFC